MWALAQPAPAGWNASGWYWRRSHGSVGRPGRHRCCPSGSIQWNVRSSSIGCCSGSRFGLLCWSILASEQTPLEVFHQDTHRGRHADGEKHDQHQAANDQDIKSLSRLNKANGSVLFWVFWDWWLFWFTKSAYLDSNHLFLKSQSELVNPSLRKYGEIYCHWQLCSQYDSLKQNF